LVAGLDRCVRVDVGLLLEQRDRRPDVVGRGGAQREARGLLVHAGDVLGRKVGTLGRRAGGVVDLGPPAVTGEGGGEAFVRHGDGATLARERPASRDSSARFTSWRRTRLTSRLRPSTSTR